RLDLRRGCAAPWGGPWGELGLRGLEQGNGSFGSGGEPVLRREAGPQLGDLFDTERLERDADGFDLAVEIAPRESGCRRAADVVGAEDCMVMQGAHGLAEQLMAERLGRVSVTPECRDQVVETQGQWRVAGF